MEGKATAELGDVGMWSRNFFFIILFNYYYYFFGYVGSRMLHGLFSSCGELEIVFVAVHGLLVGVASLAAENSL